LQGGLLHAGQGGREQGIEAGAGGVFGADQAQGPAGEVGRQAADAGGHLQALAVPGDVEQDAAAALAVGTGQELAEGELQAGKVGSKPFLPDRAEYYNLLSVCLMPRKISPK